MTHSVRTTASVPSSASSLANANTAVSLVGTVFGLAISVVGADFLTPYMAWLPKLLLGLFALAFVLSLSITKLKKRSTHWFTYASAIGVLFAAAMLLLSVVKTPPGKKSIGGLPETLSAVRAVQAKLPLDAAAQSTIAVLDNRQGSPANGGLSVQKRPTPVAAPSTEQLLLSRLETSLSSPNAQTRETAADDALVQAQSSPATFRSALRTLIRTQDTVLQEIAILHELKSLEGKQIPLTSDNLPAPAFGTIVQPNEITQQLSTLLVGTSVTVQRVDLGSSSFTGFFNSDNRYPLNGSITARGVEFTARIGFPYRDNFPLQVALKPTPDLQLTGYATINLKSGPASAPVALDLPF